MNVAPKVKLDDIAQVELVIIFQLHIPFLHTKNRPMRLPVLLYL